MRKIFTIFLLVSMMCVSICGCSSASARQETLLTIEEKTKVDALETAITATDANQTIEEPEEDVVRHTEGVDGFSKVAAFILNCTAAITAIPICVIAVTQNFTEVK